MAEDKTLNVRVGMDVFREAKDEVLHAIGDAAINPTIAPRAIVEAALKSHTDKLRARRKAAPGSYDAELLDMIRRLPAADRQQLLAQAYGDDPGDPEGNDPTPTDAD